MDWGRVLLIKPYEIIALREDDWGARSVDTADVSPSIPGVSNLNVLDSLIFIYGRETILNGQEPKAAWFVINGKNRKVWGFEDHHDYQPPPFYWDW